MPNQLIAAVANAPLASADLNTNWDLIEATAYDLGPYILTGLVPSAGAGLSVNVTAGTAVIGMHVAVGAGFAIGGLTPSTLNHLYLLQNGTGTFNTTGIAPANSVKLGTATTGVATVTSVDTTPLSGRQVKVSLTALVTTGSNVFAAQQVFLLDDATNNAATYPIILRHTVAAGAGANNIGVGLQLEAENIGGTVSQLGTFSLIATNAGSANLTTQYQFKLFNNAIARTMMTVGATDVRVEQAPPASANSALLSLGGGGYAGGGGNFAGHASGTMLAMNMDAGYAGDWLNIQSDGVEYAKIGGSGLTTHSVWDAVTNNVSTVLTLRHLANTGAGAANIGTRLEFQSETTTNDTANIAGQIDCVLTTATAGAAVSRMDLRVNNAGTITNPLSLTALGAFFSGGLQGNGQGLAYGRAQITFPSDANYTLLTAEYQCPILDVQTGVITVQRDLVVPATLGAIWLVRNQNAQAVNVKTPAGTGIVIAAGKTAFVFCGGANILRATADV